ncbi:MAG: TonB family protein, partial [Steroidobacteraceae bacterium]|nr:TonB family protein [Steroidobacteraceae bacterium]
MKLSWKTVFTCAAILAILTCGAVTPTSAADAVPANDAAPAATVADGDPSANPSAVADARASVTEPVDVQVYQAPSIEDFPTLHYPRGQDPMEKEGWVHLNFMVDPNGKAYEISVVESIGGEPFEQDAIRAVQEARFRPARDGSTPVHGGFDLSLLYATNPLYTNVRKVATPRFARAHKALADSIERGDKAAADEQIPKLEVTSIYAHVHKHLILYDYHRKWGTERQQYADLLAALYHVRRDWKLYFAKNTYVSSLNALLALALRLNDLGRALEIWEELQEHASKEQIAAWRPAMDQVERLREGGPPVHFEAEIEKGTSWFNRLFRNSFEVVVLSGRVSEIKLRCEKKFLFFRYEPNVRYTVESRVGKCMIQVVGDTGTKFDFV